MQFLVTQVKRFVQIILPAAIVERLGFFVHRKQLFFEGTFPLFIAKRSLKKSASNPDTFNKKIRYKMAHDRRPIRTTFADKVAVRDYVAKKVGRTYLANVYAILDKVDLDVFNPMVLPRNFVIKANHGSGGVIIVSDKAGKHAFLPGEKEIFGFQRFLIHPDNIDWSLIVVVLKKWMSVNYYWTPGFFPEWAYKNIQPRILIEELLSSTSGVPDDYRFFCFNGRCDFIQVDTPVYSGSGVLRDIFDRDWNKLDVTLKYPNSNIARSRPRNLEQMVKIAELLSSEIDHVRVDLYELDGRIVFGELTNYHAAGTQKFNPESFDKVFGESWHPDYS